MLLTRINTSDVLPSGMCIPVVYFRLTTLSAIYFCMHELEIVLLMIFSLEVMKAMLAVS